MNSRGINTTATWRQLAHVLFYDIRLASGETVLQSVRECELLLFALALLSFYAVSLCCFWANFFLNLFSLNLTSYFAVSSHSDHIREILGFKLFIKFSVWSQNIGS
ncbi:hypothetical protein Tcan_01111, partial [Toxocara canis]